MFYIYIYKLHACMTLFILSISGLNTPIKTSAKFIKIIYAFFESWNKKKKNKEMIKT